MRLLFSEIPGIRKEYTVQDPEWLHVPEITLGGPLLAEFSLRKEDAQTLYLSGKIQAESHLPCDKCSERFCQDLYAEFDYILKLGEDDLLELQDVECSDENCNTIYLDEPVADIAEILREQLLLAIPEKRLCSKGCKGICPDCGIDLNHGSCSCSKAVKDSPFAVLEKLKNK